MTNDQRRAIIDDAKSKGYQGSYVDLFRQAAINPSQQDMPVAQTSEQQREGLRPMHEAGRTDASMAFKDVPPNTPFNTMGMKAPINIKKYDTQGHLVKSYENVPPGLTNLDTGPNHGTVIETPARMQGGGFNEVNANVQGNTTMQSTETSNPGFLRPRFTQDFSEDTTVSYDDGNVARTQAIETTRGNRIRGNQTFSITDPQGNVTTQVDKYRNSRMMGLIPPRSTSKIIYPEQKQDGGPVKEQVGPRVPMQDTPVRSTASRNLDNDSTYNVRGWLAAGAPGGIDPGDGEFHGASIGNDGMWLKSKEHPTAWKEHMHSQLSRDPYFKENMSVVNPEGYFGNNQLQYVRRKKAQRGSVVDYLFPALESSNPVDFSQQQAKSQQDLVNKFEGDLAAEKENVQQVRQNIIPTAKRIAEGWENLSGENEKAYENILNYNPADAGDKPESKPLGPLRDMMSNRPEDLKDIMPNYNLHLANPGKYGSQRGIYCTTMGCFAYEEAGARRITDENGNPIRGNQTFVSATKKGVTGFEEVPAGERQPGDMTIITGKAKKDYNKPFTEENTVIRPHHTVIYSGEAERPLVDGANLGRAALSLWSGEGLPATDYDYNNPGAISAYSAQGGDMHEFQEVVRSNELPSDSSNKAFRFYRYIGNVPQLTRGLDDSKYNQSQADKVAAALQQNAEQNAAIQRRDTPSVEKLKGREASPIENDIPEREIVKTDKKVGKPKTRLTERVANKVKGKVYDLKDRRKSKQPKEKKEKTPSKRAAKRARVQAVKQEYKTKLENLKDSQ